MIERQAGDHVVEHVVRARRLTRGEPTMSVRNNSLVADAIPTAVEDGSIQVRAMVRDRFPPAEDLNQRIVHDVIRGLVGADEQSSAPYLAIVLGSIEGSELVVDPASRTPRRIPTSRRLRFVHGHQLCLAHDSFHVRDICWSQ
jgi:hypothetical protein